MISKLKIYHLANVKSFSSSVLAFIKNISGMFWLYSVPGPNNESKITKKIRYFTPFLKNNEITNCQKLRYLSENITEIYGSDWEIH